MLTHLVIIRSLILVLYFVIFVLIVTGHGICVLSTKNWEDFPTALKKYEDRYDRLFRCPYERQKRYSYGDRPSEAPPMIPRCDSELRVPLIIWHENQAARAQYAVLILLIVMFISAVGPLRGALDGKKHKGCARVFCCVLSVLLSAGEVTISIYTPVFLDDTLWIGGSLVGPSYSAYGWATWAYVESWMVAAFLFLVVFILQAIDYYNDRNPDLHDGCCGDSCDCGCCGDSDDQLEQVQKRNLAATGPQPKTGIEQIAMIGQPPVSTTNQPPQIVVTPQQQPSTSVVNKSKIDPSMPKSDSESSKKGSNGSSRSKSQEPTAGTNPIAKMV